MASDYLTLKKAITQGEFAPAYLFFGEEPYFRDRLAELLQTKVLAGGDPSFNLDLAYGSELRAGPLVANMRSFPVMASWRLAIVKELHKAPKAELDQLAAYLAQPAPTTVLLLIHPDKKQPARNTKFGKAVDKHARVFESKGLRERELPGWVETAVKEKGYTIQPDASALLAQGVGDSLARIAQELEKIYLHLELHQQSTITRDLVYDYVAIDRRYNNFELNNALAARQVDNTLHIAHQLCQNLRNDGELNGLLTQLHNFFTQLALVQQAPSRDPKALQKQLGLNYYAAQQTAQAARIWPANAVQQAQQGILEAQASIMGLSGSRMSAYHVLMSLLARVFKS